MESAHISAGSRTAEDRRKDRGNGGGGRGRVEGSVIGDVVHIATSVYVSGNSGDSSKSCSGISLNVGHVGRVRCQSGHSVIDGSKISSKMAKLRSDLVEPCEEGSAICSDIAVHEVVQYD